jgi:hypothetical protein
MVSAARTPAQSAAVLDSADLMRGLMSFVLAKEVPGAAPSLEWPVFVDSHFNRWTELAGKAFLQLAPDSLVPKNDSIAYYSLHFRIESVELNGATATIRAMHSYCFANPSGRGMNFWGHPITYRLVRHGSRWEGESQRLTMYLDGSCPPYKPKQTQRIE